MSKRREVLILKRLCCLVLATILCFCLSACVEDAPSKEIAETSSKTEKVEEVFGLNETAVFSNLKFTATEMVESNGEDFFSPKNDNVFVGIKFTIENISDVKQTVSTLLLFEGYCDDIKAEYSLNAACVFDEGTLDGTITPGKKLVGWYALEVPKDWSNIELQVQSDWLSNNSAKFVFTK